MKHKLFKYLFVGALALGGFAVSAHAQERMEVLERKDPMIETLQKLRAASSGLQPSAGNAGGGNNSQAAGGASTKVSGFRVQIYSGNNRNDAYSAQARFKRIYPSINTYLSYTQPNYRVKVGDFANRAQAENLMQELKKNFDSVFIFNEEVTIEY